MITILDFELKPSKYIHGDDCCLHVDSTFAREFDGNLSLLQDCCADNADTDGVDYHAAVKDYNESVKSVKSAVKNTNLPDMIVKVGDQISLSGKEVVITKIISGTQIIVEPVNKPVKPAMAGKGKHEHSRKNKNSK